MTNELLPCPFDGKSNFDVHTQQIEVGWFAAFLLCKTCGLQLIGEGNTEQEALEHLKKKWNTRAERTCHPVEKFTEDSPWPVMVCSECGRQLHYDEHREMDYQPYCGCGAKVVSE